MKNQINWDREDCWNEYGMYNEYFLSIHLDGAGVDEDKWKELTKKYELNIVTYDCRDISICNNDYSIVVSGKNYHEVPGSYLMITISKNAEMSMCIRFFGDFMEAIDGYDDLTVRNGVTGEYTCHPKEIVRAMIEKL